MPRETVQLPSTNGAIATETTVRWTHEDQGGHVQLCIQRYPDGLVASPEDEEEPVITRGDSIRGSLKDRKVKDGVVGEIDPTKLQPAVSPFGVAVHPEPGVTVELPTRTSLGAGDVEFLKQKLAEEGDVIEAAEAGIQSAFNGLRTALPGSYILPPADGLVGVEPDGSVVLWTDPLDRTAINKLIKALRRARDQAYGRDE